MPCDTRIKTSVVELAKANRKRLVAILQSEGWLIYNASEALLYAGHAGVLLTIENGQATLSTGTADQANDVLAHIRRAYAARTVSDVSARFGFKVQGTEQLLGGAQRVLLRR